VNVLPTTNKGSVIMNDQTLNPLSYVGFWIRFLAFILDSIVVLVLLYFVALFIPVSVDISTVNLANQDELIALLPDLLPRMGLDALLTALLFLLLWSFIRSSLGKVVFRAYIVNNMGQKASFGQLLIRYLGYFVSVAFFGLGFIWIAFDAKKQGWHDKLAGTVVIYRK
jgi:uncharacterized RDD family membrane protein YckC